MVAVGGRRFTVDALEHERQDLGALASTRRVVHAVVSTSGRRRVTPPELSERNGSQAESVGVLEKLRRGAVPCATGDWPRSEDLRQGLGLASRVAEHVRRLQLRQQGLRARLLFRDECIPSRALGCRDRIVERLDSGPFGTPQRVVGFLVAGGRNETRQRAIASNHARKGPTARRACRRDRRPRGHRTSCRREGRARPQAEASPAGALAAVRRLPSPPGAVAPAKNGVGKIEGNDAESTSSGTKVTSLRTWGPARARSGPCGQVEAR